MKRIIPRAAAILLTIFLPGMLPLQALAASTAALPPKEEVVYVKLQADGSFGSAYVVNSFDLPAAAGFSDYGPYRAVHNLTTTAPLSLREGVVALQAPAGRFYYQGDLETATLPWLIEISYQLDGVPVNAAALPGAAGTLEVKLDITDNPSAPAAFTENYIVQVALELNRDLARVIQAKGATVASAGAKQILNLIKFPDEAAQFRIVMEVTGFEMDGIQISAVPFSMDFALPDSSGLVKDLHKLEDGIGELDSGAKELADGTDELTAGAQKLNDGLHEMNEAMEKLQKGFRELTDHNDDLGHGSRQIREALNEINDGLKGFDAAAGDLSGLTEGSAAIKAGLEGLAGGLGQLQGGIAGAGDLRQANETAIASLEQKAAVLLQMGLESESEETQALAALLAANNSLLTGLQSGINGNGTAENPGLAGGAVALAGQYAQFDAAIQALPAQLGEMAAGIGGLKNGIDQLAAQYRKEFHPGLTGYLSGTVELEDGYRQLVKGFAEIVDGSDELQDGLNTFQDGVAELAEGTGEMKSETTGMDVEARKKIDDLLASYTPGNFAPVSFTSSRNTNIHSVQFVMLTESIKPAEKDAASEPAPVKINFWQRLLALFSFLLNRSTLGG